MTKLLRIERRIGGDLVIVDDAGKMYETVSLSSHRHDLLHPITLGQTTGEPGEGDDWRWPYQYSVGVIQGDSFAQFGPRSPTRMHNGLDFGAGAVQGKNNTAAGSGMVVAAGWDGTFGNRVIIDHGDHEIDGVAQNVKTLYAHMVNLFVGAGQPVLAGAELGKMGATGGNSTGVHLHWETHVNGTPINPRGFMASVGVPES
jgi:murein DD-endopeptidase MepM/ murein hydrolase activator NlpD